MGPTEWVYWWRAAWANGRNWVEVFSRLLPEDGYNQSPKRRILRMLLTDEVLVEYRSNTS